MSLPKACCTLPPISHEYNEIGKYTQVGDFQVYESCNDKSKGTLLVAYDIFGFHNATHQFVDNIASKTGLRVLVPDFFRGNPTKPEDFPPKDFPAFVKNLNEVAGPEKCTKMVKQVFEHYKIDSTSGPVAVIGFCWGAMMGHQIIKSMPNQFKALAVCHPSLWDDETGSEITVPLIAIPTKDDFDMTKFFENLKPEIREKSEHYLFNDVHHGFAAARANLSDETNVREYNRAIELISEFFNKRLF